MYRISLEMVRIENGVVCIKHRIGDGDYHYVMLDEGDRFEVDIPSPNVYFREGDTGNILKGK